MSDTNTNVADTAGLSAREKILAAANKVEGRTEEFDFFDQKVYFRRPSLRELQANQLDDSQKDEATAFLIVTYLYDTVTDKKVFEATDLEVVMDMPFCADTQRLQNKVGEFLGIDLEASVKNSEATTGNSPS